MDVFGKAFSKKQKKNQCQGHWIKWQQLQQELDLHHHWTAWQRRWKSSLVLFHKSSCPRAKGCLSQDSEFQFLENCMQICTMDTKQSQTSAFVINCFGPCTTGIIKADP